MEHLVQFTFSVDDRAIQQRLEESAYKDVVDELRRNVESALPRKWSYDKGVDWRQFASDVANEFFESHKAEIIDAAAKYLADRLAKTKTAKGLVE